MDRDENSGVIWHYGGMWHYACDKWPSVCSFDSFGSCAEAAWAECGGSIRVRVMKNDPIGRYAIKYKEADGGVDR